MHNLHPADRSALDPGKGPKSNPDNMAVAKMFFDDNSRLIAAGKIQRWELVKWAVTANLALTAAAIAFHDAVYGALVLLVASIGAIILACILLRRQDEKLYRARGTMNRVLNFMISQGVDYTAITGRCAPENKSPKYDSAEMHPFLIMICSSGLPVAAAAFWAVAQAVGGGG